MQASTEELSEKVTKPKPLDLGVSFEIEMNKHD